MIIIKASLVGFVAILHVYFLVLEMFLWVKPFGLKTFRMNIKQAEATKTLAANQGLYNGFIAAGLFWSLLAHNPETSTTFAIFFLSCVIVAGIYGGYTVSKKIFFIQSGPAMVALLLTLCG